jgi:hypothetical protein
MQCSNLKPVFRSSGRNVLRCNNCQHIVEIVSKAERKGLPETCSSDELALWSGAPGRRPGRAPAACRAGDKEPVAVKHTMNYQGIEFSFAETQPGLWQWQFQIGETVKNGKTETNLQGIAAHRVQRRIDREIKQAQELAARRSRAN